MKIIIYAPGGGGGHFNRSLALLSRFAKTATSWVIIHSSPLYLQIKDLLDQTNIRVEMEPDSANRTQLLLSHLDKADLLIVDTFRFGPDNELEGLSITVPLIFLWRSSLQSFAQITRRQIDTTPPLLTLIPTSIELQLVPYIEHSMFIGFLILFPEYWSNLDIVIPVDNPQISSYQIPEQIVSSQHKPQLRVTMVHLGSKAELEYLYEEVEILKQMYTVQLSVYNRTNIVYPGFLIMSRADLVLCGGGYNVLAEVIAYKTTAISLCFTREFDDQFQRVISYQYLYPAQIFYSARNYLHHRSAP